ncbi:hypothetical protein BCU84_13000 [Shewanella sp. 10N.286.51.B7]|uniref:M16 family metallopeptidase n=1 Tax=Shewanella sp. 10N.286.51.B7 TaxID=1880836 RepID=UPI000C859080|nr:insulinase family protein [Shewanella sp. 10N.286.51.B7]PMG76486.1 hypothetical protein BCU84_13000 [Shewanella sp. 10N.286.51.B7]
MRTYHLSLLIILTSFLLLGCQHSPIIFTESQPPKVPQFAELDNAPKLPSLSAPLIRDNNIGGNTSTQVFNEPNSININDKLSIHQWAVNQEDAANQPKLNRVYFIGISPSASLENPDVLIEAFSQRRKELANQQQHKPNIAACYDSIRFRASLHSIAITMQCDAPFSEMQSLVWAFWDENALTNLNIETVQRNLKLNKHIGAFTGSEIDKVFRSQLLGPQHPYNESLDNQGLVDSLENTETGFKQLQHLQLATRELLQWHLFTNDVENSFIHDSQKTLNQPLIERKTAENLHSKTINDSLPLWLLHDSSTSDNMLNNKASHTASNTVHNTKTLTAEVTPKDQITPTATIYLIDAPDTVQTQVRVGFVSENANNLLNHHQQTATNNSVGCKTIAPLLGRSYSGRLFYDLRETRGLTYGIYGRCVNAPLSQYLYFYGSTALENSGAFIKGILDHTQLLTESTVSQAELNAVSTYLIGQQQLALDTTFGKESNYIRNILSGKTTQQAQQEVNAISQLTPEQFLQISNHVLSHPPTVVIRGDADKISADIRQKLPSWQVQLISAHD